MRHLTTTFGLPVFGAIALTLFTVSSTAFAVQDKVVQETDKKVLAIKADVSHDGKLVSITNEEIRMTNMDGKEHSHSLAADAKFTLDGKVCKIADLKSGTRIRVMTPGSDDKMAIRVEAIDKNVAFASNVHDGTFVSVSDDTLLMKSAEGKEHSHKLSSELTVTLDGNDCKVADLKKGTEIRVTTQDAFSTVATGIEAIVENDEFARINTDGIFVSMTGTTLVITTMPGREQYTSIVVKNAKITCDAKVCKSSDLKPGMRIRLTPSSSDPNATGQIEALDKEQDFKVSK